MILPGVCSQKTTDMMHLMACIVQPVLEVIGTRDNKPRAEMDAIAGKVGLDFIVNTVMDEDKNLLGVFSGHYIEAHRKATEMAEQVMVIPIPAQADILIVSANPCHFDYWQGIKPYTYAHRAVRKGGVLIFSWTGWKDCAETRLRTKKPSGSTCLGLLRIRKRRLIGEK